MYGYFPKSWKICNRSVSNVILGKLYYVHVFVCVMCTLHNMNFHVPGSNYTTQIYFVRRGDAKMNAGFSVSIMLVHYYNSQDSCEVKSSKNRVSTYFQRIEFGKLIVFCRNRESSNVSNLGQKSPYSGHQGPFVRYSYRNHHCHHFMMGVTPEFKTYISATSRYIVKYEHNQHHTTPPTNTIN